MGKLKAKIQPSIDRFNDFSLDKKEMFQSTVGRFFRIYSFITQVCCIFDKELHKFFVYLKLLNKFLPKGSSTKVDIDDKILLEYYKLEKYFNGSITLNPTE